MVVFEILTIWANRKNIFTVISQTTIVTKEGENFAGGAERTLRPTPAAASTSLFALSWPRNSVPPQGTPTRQPPNVGITIYEKSALL